MASFDDDDDDVLHMRRFKCIGAEHKTPWQEFLGVVEREMHEENVPVKARPRPEPKEETREMQLPRIRIMALAGSVSGTLQRTYKVSAPCHTKRQTGGGRCQAH